MPDTENVKVVDVTEAMVTVVSYLLSPVPLIVTLCPTWNPCALEVVMVAILLPLTVVVLALVIVLVMGACTML